MKQLECWTNIPNEEERRAVMAWVRSSDFESYSEIGDKVSVTWKEKPNNPETNSHYWGIIHFFEQYPEHAIYGKES